MAGKVTRARRIASVVLLAVLVVGSVYFYQIRKVRFFLVPSRSMAPTLLSRDYIVSVGDVEYRRGDIVVLRDPEIEGSFVVKRIVGLPGDTVAIGGGALYLNGRYASEPYIMEPMLGDLPALTLEGRQVFVLGDNRNESEDSLSWLESGVMVTLDDIVGKVVYIYNPISRMGPVASYPLEPTGGLGEAAETQS